MMDFLLFEEAVEHKISFPSPEDIEIIAHNSGYVERRPEASSTLFFKEKKPARPDCPVLINVFYTTRGIMTKIPHPISGYNQLWRSSAYSCTHSLYELFENPRTHTGRGYRKAKDAVRGCCDCGDQKKRTEFSKNQWRKGPGNARCLICVQEGKKRKKTTTPPINQITPPINQILLNQMDQQVSRECIQCDAEGCPFSSPYIRCQNCLAVYYCSQTCRLRHAREHEDDCRMGAWLIEMSRANPHEGKGYSEQERHGMGAVAMAAGRRDFEGVLRIADYHLIEGRWNAAIEIYESIFDEGFFRPPPKMREIIMGLTRCFYEVQRYEDAIDMGRDAIEMNRQFPEVYKYVALSQKALGDNQGAIATAKQAVLYETPWDEDNIQKNMAFLQELEADCR